MNDENTQTTGTETNAIFDNMKEESKESISTVTAKDSIKEKVDETSNVTQHNSTLPAGWAELYEEASGRVYYFYQQTNVTQWVRPENLLPGWVEFIDPTSGTPYYCNQTTNATQ